jgi:hypothetical protein
VRGGIEVCRDRAERCIAHGGQEVVISNVSRPDQFDAGLVDAAFDKLLEKRAALSRQNKDEDRIGPCIFRALQEWREVRPVPVVSILVSRNQETEKTRFNFKQESLPFREP